MEARFRLPPTAPVGLVLIHAPDPTSAYPMTELSADRPSSIDDDLFGHAPFAKALTDAISRYQSSEGLVLALYGPWGSGKSTVLGFITHYIEEMPEEGRPIVVPFNPWWFSGQDNLARAFLGQLEAVLPSKSERFKQLGGLLADFAEGIGGLIDLTGMSGGWGSRIGALIGRAAKRKPKDVPAIKSKISKILLEAQKRILVIIDDIDRLAPDETRQLFTVIKALADFPNVVYLLAFDREVAAHAIEQGAGLPGDQYLEKIIQVPVELPAVDRVALRSTLFKRLERILGDTPDDLFDQSYWSHVFLEGLDPLFRVPRHVVRFTNTLSVTYPAVRGEVNPIDFIALEAIRVFLPDTYAILHANPESFSGYSPDSTHAVKPEAAETFTEKWVNSIPEPLRASTKALLERVFPKLSRLGHGPEWLNVWRRTLRACHPDIFPIYFRYSIASGLIRRDEIMAFLALAASPTDFEDALIRALAEKRPDGLSKARALLERLMDHVERDLPNEHIPGVIQALFSIGDSLIDPADERGLFDFGNAIRASRPVYHLLKRLPPQSRANVLGRAIKGGKALIVQMKVLRALEEDASKPGVREDMVSLSAESVSGLKTVWVERARELSREATFIDHPDLPQVLGTWRQWSDGTDARSWCREVTATDQGMMMFLQRFLQNYKTQTSSDGVTRTQPRLNPKWLEPFIDTTSCADRLEVLTKRREVPEVLETAVSQYLREFAMLKVGENPEALDAFDA